MIDTFFEFVAIPGSDEERQLAARHVRSRLTDPDDVLAALGLEDA